MEYQWKQKGLYHYEYRAENPENTLHGEVFKEKDSYHGWYLKDGEKTPLPDSYRHLGSAQTIVSGRVKRKSSVERV